MRTKPLNWLLLLFAGLVWTTTIDSAVAEEKDGPKKTLLGTWTNTDPGTRWYRKIAITDEDGKIFMALWATQGGQISREPVAKIELPVDGKNPRLPRLTGISAKKDYEFMEETFTLKFSEGVLKMTGQAFFKDNTDRNRTVTESFDREKKE